MNTAAEQPWADDHAIDAMTTAVRHGMPAESLAVYARWWQLETWLRELIYVELRAKFGREWEAVVARAAHRQSQDAAFSHMESSDSRNPLAYLDYSQLVELIADHWELFDRTLLERRSWEGRQEDLKRIRHRMGHMRVPHKDDVARIEQTLRDLERGAFIALAAYNRRTWSESSDDAVTEGWLRGTHEDARRLLRHAEQQYETRLILRWSRRPWATADAMEDGAPGLLWHADFVMRDRSVEVQALWRDSAMRQARPLLVHVLAEMPWSVGFTFSAADPASEIADAIGAAFDALLLTSHRGIIDSDEHDAWAERARRADYRVKNRSGWTVVDETTLPISNFGSGGGVHQLPES